jgi:uncharacterized protein with PIN domain
MLGGLARWLRILGQDVIYDADAMDNELLRIAVEEKMILLTRDRELQMRALAKNLESALILGETEEERLAEMAKAFGLSLEVVMTETKCPECGSTLREASKREIANKVPQRSLELYDRYWTCSDRDCGKVYWIGSHWKQMHRTLEEARKLAILKP